MSLDGFSMHPLVQELDKALAGGRIDKITQPNKQSVMLSIRQPGQNRLLYISINPQNPVMHLLPAPLENPAEPPTFCMVLRKQIETGRIAAVRQHGLDRILILDIDFLAAGGKIVTKSLVAELMGKYSNIILIQDGMIIDALRKIGTTSSRVRLVLPGEAYALPPNQDKLDALHTPAEEIIAALRQHPEAKLSKAFSEICLGFGPVTAKEIAFSAGLAANALISTLDDADFASLTDALRETIRANTAETPQPCLILDGNRKLLAMAAFPLHYLSEGEQQSFTSLSEMLAAATKLTGSYVPPDKDRFKKLVHNELNRAENKLTVLQKEAVEAENAEEYRIKADNLMTYQYSLQDHADKEITVSDIYSTEGAQLTIALDQRVSINQNIQSYYHKYNKLKRAQELLKQQLAECQGNIRYLASIETSLIASTSLAEIADIRAELISSGYLREKLKKKPSEKPSQPFKFTAPDGTQILVGKNNYQNDRLTFKIAQYNDIWLHTKDIPGSHVILRCGGSEPAEETLSLAASLAAHFSQAAGSSNIPVDYTACRYVKKPSGSKPGFVIFTNQKTLYVTPDEKELAPVLAQDAGK